jgi:hypothetical protein
MVMPEETGERMKHEEEPANEQDEQQCIQTFLGWHNNRFKTSFTYQRAEDVFPGITDSTRWDFIIRQNEYSPWYAAEIKRLIRPEAIIQLINWNGLLKRIRNDLRSRLRGEFLVYGVPSLKLEKQKRIKLKRVLTEVILQNAQSMRNRESVELGSQILSRFPEWPHTKHLNPHPPPPTECRVKKEYCFTLEKVADTGCSLELAFAQPGVFILNQVVVEALTALFQKGEMSQANKQLGLAKQKGAKETILLLDYHLPPSWYPNHAKQVLANKMDSPQLADIDYIYLVKASENRVSKVWGKRQKLVNTN